MPFERELVRDLLLSTALDRGHTGPEIRYVSCQEVGRTGMWTGRIEYVDGQFDVVEGDELRVTCIIGPLRAPIPHPQSQIVYRMQRQIAKSIEEQRQEIARIRERHRQESEYHYDGDLFDPCRDNDPEEEN